MLPWPLRDALGKASLRAGKHSIMASSQRHFDHLFDAFEKDLPPVDRQSLPRNSFEAGISFGRFHFLGCGSSNSWMDLVDHDCSAFECPKSEGMRWRESWMHEVCCQTVFKDVVPDSNS